MNAGKPKRSYVHNGGDTPLIGVTIPQLFEDIVARFSEHEAVVSMPQDVRFNYSSFRDKARQLAKALLAVGVSKGDRVGIWSTNNLEWVLLQMATAYVGAILVNINPAYRVEELQHALARARVQILFLIPSFRFCF